MLDIKTIADKADTMKTKAQQKMVKESLTRAFNDLRAGKVNHDALNLFAE